MSDQIPIIKMYTEEGDVAEHVVFAGHIYVLLEVDEPYEDWLKRVIDYGFEEQADFFVSYPAPDDSESDEDDAEHLMTVDMAKAVCTLHGSEQGRQLRRALVESEARDENPGDEPGEKRRFDGRDLNRDELFWLAAGLHSEKVELEAEVEKLRRVNYDLRDLINRMLEQGLQQ